MANQSSDEMRFVTVLLAALVVAAVAGGSFAVLSQPPSPAPRTFGQDQQQHAGSKKTIEGALNSPAQDRPAAASKVNSDVDSDKRSAKGQERQDATASNWWGTAPDWIVAIAALVALLIYGTQASHMKSANEATNAVIAQMRLEQRAWLSITAEITSLSVGWPLGVDFIIANSGRTPAMIRKVKIGAGIPSDYRLVDYDQIVMIHTNTKPWEHRENTVAPNGSYNVHLEKGHVVTQNELDSLAPNKTGVLYFLVTVQYSDFADGRESQVLLTYDLSINKFRQWERHNYMT